jgi:hypothetical protein
MDDASRRFFDMLSNAVGETFETLTFSEISGWRILASAPPDMEECIGSAIRLRRPIKGLFALFLHRDLCWALIETVYGPEVLNGGEESDFLNDFLGELVNTIAGRFAAVNASEEGQIYLGLPKAVQPADIPARAVFSGFELEGVPAYCCLEI